MNTYTPDAPPPHFYEHGYAYGFIHDTSLKPYTLMLHCTPSHSNVHPHIPPYTLILHCTPSYPNVHPTTQLYTLALNRTHSLHRTPPYSRPYSVHLLAPLHRLRPKTSQPDQHFNEVCCASIYLNLILAIFHMKKSANCSGAAVAGLLTAADIYCCYTE